MAQNAQLIANDEPSLQTRIWQALRAGAAQGQSPQDALDLAQSEGVLQVDAALALITLARLGLAKKSETGDGYVPLEALTSSPAVALV
jgi:hypothetical protein